MTETHLIGAPVRASHAAYGALTRTIFDGSPFGLLVAEAGGTVIAANPAGHRHLVVERLIGENCCVLLGCHDPDGPLSDGCVTERALGSSHTLPEVRIDFRATDGLRAVWVTASPLGADRVLVHLRPGRPGDRRRRSDTAWSGGPTLHLRVLGRTQVQAPEGPLDGPWLRQRPGQLLKFLVCRRPRLVAGDELVATFWPEAGRTGVQNVRYSVHDLRSRLEPGREPRQPSSFIVGRDGAYGLDADRVSVDADSFEQHARAGLDDRRGARDALRRAAALYRGPFLGDEPYADWAFAERDRLHELAIRVLDALATLELETGDHEAATSHLQRLAEIEPLDAGVQRRLITLLLEQGRSGEALRRYKQLQASWHSAFGEGVGFELSELRDGGAQAAA
jgi:DNA-binding SARP family transcriptional activator